MESARELMVIVLILLNLRLLGASRLNALVDTTVLQAMVIGALAFLSHPTASPWILAMVAAVTAVKAGLLPFLVRRAIRETGVTRELAPLVGYTVSLLLGAGMLGLGYLAATPLLIPFGGAVQPLVPVTLFTVLTGLFLIVARRKAITQVLGFITLENGIYLFGVAFAVREPWLVQTGVLLDLFAAVFVMGIMICQINREFDHIDTDRLSTLRD